MATFAPNCTVFAFAGSVAVCGRFAMLQPNGAVSASCFMNGTVEVEEKKNASLPVARSP